MSIQLRDGGRAYNDGVNNIQETGQAALTVYGDGGDLNHAHFEQAGV